jgi:uncharacterized protein YecT (DUF1311 family)
MFGTVAAQAPGTHSSIADAKREYAVVFSHPDKPCSGKDADTTVGYEECMSKELDFLNPHLETFVKAMRSMATDSDVPPEARGSYPSVLDSFNKTDASWRSYRDNFCRLASSWDNGTELFAADSMQCAYEMDRAYVKDLAHWASLNILAN